MFTFSDIVNFQYTDKEVDKDIRHLLKTDEFKPLYADMVRGFLASEIANCKQTIDDENHHLTIQIKDTMLEDGLTRTPEEINPILDRLGFAPEIREFWFNYYVNPTHGQQKSPPLGDLQNGNKKEISTPFGLAIDAFYTTYTEIHELMHGVQGKYFKSERTDSFNEEHYQLLYQGKSRDEAKAIQRANNPDLAKDLQYDRSFKEMQANSAATCYMMLHAVRTGDKNIISAVEKRLLNESAAMSGALMREDLGLAYFEYPATKKIIEEVKQGKCDYLLSSKGLLNWKELYVYTKDKVEEMGYSKEDIFTSLKTAKMLSEIKGRHIGNKDAFLEEVFVTAPTLESPHNKIFNHFVEAQKDFVWDKSKDLHKFYHRLGAKSLKEKTLETATPQNVPNIEEYRRIYQINKSNKNINVANIAASSRLNG